MAQLGDSRVASMASTAMRAIDRRTREFTGRDCT
jgi:hypothetical protein